MILTDLGIECYYISNENITPEGDYIIYNFRSKGKKYGNNKETRREYTVYVNYYITKASTIENKIQTLLDTFRENKFLNNGNVITVKDDTGYYNTSITFKYYK